MSKNDKPIIIVTGLVRSGLALVISILEKSGLSVLHTSKKYDYDLVHKMQVDSSFLADAGNKVIKIPYHYIKHLPRDYKYKVIVMERELLDIFYSRTKHLNAPNQNWKYPSLQLESMQMIKDANLRFLDTLPNIEKITIPYTELVNYDVTTYTQLLQFLHIDFPISNLHKVIDKSLMSSYPGYTGLLRADRAPKSVVPFIEQYSEDKVFCEIGVGDGYVINGVKNTKRKFGVERNERLYKNGVSRYPDIKFYFGAFQELADELHFDVCYMWIIYPFTKEIVDHILNVNDDAVIIIGLTYYYHLNKDDPKFQKYISLYPDSENARNWNDYAKEHEKELVSRGYSYTVHDISDESTKETFSLAVIRKG